MGIVRFKFHEGAVEEFKRLSAECLEVVRSKEPGTLQYDTYLNEDGSRAVVIERFRDSESLIAHGENLAAYMEPILATAEVEGELLGEPNAELRARMSGSSVGLFKLYQAL